MNPIALSLFGFDLRWYAIAWMLGIFGVWSFSTYLLRTPSLWSDECGVIRPRHLNGLVPWLALGLILGAHATYILIYADKEFSFERLIDLRVGGMTSHGSLLGAAVAVFFYGVIKKLPVLVLSDVLALGAPLGIFVIRVANFANGDIQGKFVEFAGYSFGLRHPVALYEAALEGLLIFVLLLLLLRKRILHYPGLATGVFVLAYTSIRAFLEPLRDGLVSTNSKAWFAVLTLAFAAIGLLLMWASIQILPRLKNSSNLRSSYAGDSGWWSGFTKLVFVAALSAVLPGEFESADSPNPVEVYPLSIQLTNPGGDPAKCPCENSRGAYILNSSSAAYRGSWTIRIKDRISGEYFPDATGNDLIQPGTTNRYFIGCTIYSPNLFCRFSGEHSLNRWGKETVTPADKVALYGSTSSPSIATCVNRCSDPNGECLRLGVRFYKGIAPLSEMITQADVSGGSVAKKEILARYGVTEDFDQCKRGDITRENDKYINEGNSPGKLCTIPSEDLPSNVLAALGLPNNPSSPTKMFTVLPGRIEAVRGAAIRSLSASEVTIFDQSLQAPFLTFDGASGKEFTAGFGGPVLASARIAISGLPKQTVVATANGCIAVDER